MTDARSPESTRTPRGPLLLSFGLASLLPSPLFVLGAAAWLMGGNDLKAMAAGRMDVRGARSTRWGRWLGLAGLALNLLWVAKRVLLDGVGRVS